MLLEKVKDEKVQRSILAGLTGIIGSHSAFSRTLSQVYLSRNADKLSATHKELLEPFFKYIREDKSAFIIAKKVIGQLEDMMKVMNSTISGWKIYRNICGHDHDVADQRLRRIPQRKLCRADSHGYQQRHHDTR